MFIHQMGRLGSTSTCFPWVWSTYLMAAAVGTQMMSKGTGVGMTYVIGYFKIDRGVLQNPYDTSTVWAHELNSSITYCMAGESHRNKYRLERR